jgi:hypothetical protein
MIGEAMIGEAMIGEAMDRIRKRENRSAGTRRSKPSAASGGAIGIGFGSDVRAPRPGPAFMPENAGR